jgi:hypothetical protein
MGGILVNLGSAVTGISGAGELMMISPLEIGGRSGCMEESEPGMVEVWHLWNERFMGLSIVRMGLRL